MFISICKTNIKYSLISDAVIASTSNQQAPNIEHQLQQQLQQQFCVEQFQLLSQLQVSHLQWMKQ